MNEPIILINSVVANNGNNWLSFDSVPIGEIWKITNVAAINKTSRFNGLRFYVNHQHKTYGWLHYYFYRKNTIIKARKLITSREEIYLSNEDYIDVLFKGCISGDQLEIYLFGCKEENNDGQIV